MLPHLVKEADVVFRVSAVVEGHGAFIASRMAAKDGADIVCYQHRIVEAGILLGGYPDFDKAAESFARFTRRWPSLMTGDMSCTKTRIQARRFDSAMLLQASTTASLS